jgi:hypothetical protein
MEFHPHPIGIVHYGLGAIGSAIARLTTAQRGLQVVGAIDHDPAKVGGDIGEAIGLGHPIGAFISDDPGSVLRRTQPDVVIHATTSLFHEVYPRLRECIQARANVLSTCEELVYPRVRDPAAAAELDRLGLKHRLPYLAPESILASSWIYCRCFSPLHASLN